MRAICSCASRSMCAAATVLGVVGAGGIGEDLYVAIRQFEYPDISAILLLLIAHGFDHRPHLRDHPPPPDRPRTAEGAMTMSTSYSSAVSPDELQRLRSRHPDVFVRSHAGAAARMGALAVCSSQSSSSASGGSMPAPCASGTGSAKLGFLVRFMFPPSDGGAFWEYAYAHGRNPGHGVPGHADRGRSSRCRSVSSAPRTWCRTGCSISACGACSTASGASTAWSGR